MQKHVEVSLQASYRTMNEYTDRTKFVWLVFHGYGQLTEFFIRKFQVLDPDDHFIIAPQGLSKFYLEGFSGRVGATWMTKEDRLTEIDNQQRYLRAVLESEVGDLSQGKKLILFGFSQGVATMCRFAAYNDFSFDRMVLWAGTFPHDLSKEDTRHWPSDFPMKYFTGRDDPFLKPGMIEAQEERLIELTGVHPEITQFDGKHEVRPELLHRVYQ
ncbi:MAG: alpha/beta hydrolase [Bacteroidota bacterium]